MHIIIESYVDCNISENEWTIGFVELFGSWNNWTVGIPCVTGVVNSKFYLYVYTDLNYGTYEYKFRFKSGYYGKIVWFNDKTINKYSNGNKVIIVNPNNFNVYTLNFIVDYLIPNNFDKIGYEHSKEILLKTIRKDTFETIPGMYKYYDIMMCEACENDTCDYLEKKFDETPVKIIDKNKNNCDVCSNTRICQCEFCVESRSHNECTFCCDHY